MTKIFKQMLMAFSIVLFLAACGTAQKVQSFDNSSFFTKSKAKSKIEQAIQAGAANKGWRTKKIKNGLITASIIVRNRHYVAVDINYNSKGYIITYKESREMNYDPKTQAIHKNYNKWVRLLQNKINFQLDNLGMHSATRHTTKSQSEKTGKKEKTLNLDGKTIYIKPYTRFAPNSKIAQNIKNECTLQKAITDSIIKYSSNSGVTFIVKNNIKPNELQLKVQIEQAISSGNAAIGHNKFVSISGKIVKGNTQYYSFDAARLSGGGYFGAYRSSCSVLGRIASALGKDISIWLGNPYNNAMMGDTHLIRN